MGTRLFLKVDKYFALSESHSSHLIYHSENYGIYFLKGLSKFTGQTLAQFLFSRVLSLSALVGSILGGTQLCCD